MLRGRLITLIMFTDNIIITSFWETGCYNYSYLPKSLLVVPGLLVQQVGVEAQVVIFKTQVQQFAMM